MSRVSLSARSRRSEPSRLALEHLHKIGSDERRGFLIRRYLFLEMLKYRHTLRHERCKHAVDANPYLDDYQSADLNCSMLGGLGRDATVEATWMIRGIFIEEVHEAIHWRDIGLQ